MTDPVRAAARGCCPRCGRGRLYAGLLRLNEDCPNCGLDIAAFNVGDGPAAFLILVIGAVIAVGADLLLTGFFGREFGAGATALRISMVAMVPLSITRLLASDLKGRGRPGIVSIGAAVALVATVVFNLLLIPAMGIEGAAIASLIAYALGACVLMAAFRRLAEASPWSLLPRASDFGRLWEVGIAWAAGLRGSTRT